tara:strand:- start:258 stop:608 length:351 start_codon:yes stop_codon:yes gene_type:complete
MKIYFNDLNFSAFMPLTDDYAVSVVIMYKTAWMKEDYPGKTLYEIGVMRRINKDTDEYELEQDGPNYHDVMYYLEKDEVEIVMNMIKRGDYTYYGSRIANQRMDDIRTKTILTKHK